MQIHTLLHGTHIETQTHARRAGQCRVLVYSHVLECPWTQVNADEHTDLTQARLAPELFWARPKANKVRGCQLPTGPSHCVTGLSHPAPTLRQPRLSPRRTDLSLAL